jgi:glutathione S-transferase
MTAYPLTTLVTLLAIGLYFYMGLRVGLSRAKYNVPAPATTGNPDWERLFRIHANTLEAMPIFLPLLWLFSLYHSDLWAALIGLVWVAGRIVFMLGYSQSAEKRETGFLIQLAATAILFLGTLVGVGQVFLAGAASL